jgi:hypothetical protein
MAPDAFPEIAAATGAMRIGRRTYEVAKSQRDAGQPGGKEYGGGWPGPVFVLTLGRRAAGGGRHVPHR